VKEIAISKFKATCLAVLDDVRRTGKPVRVTRFGQPMADIVPPSAVPNQRIFGGMRDSMEIVGDITKPWAGFKAWKPKL
jgi:antitoxin (DNA-binding transcriptional repressor) of toxin-antitoxin stability system